MRHVRQGVTVIELLIVMAVLAMVASLLLPVALNARETARRTQCTDHLRQIGTAMRQYHEQHKVFPPGQVAIYGAGPNEFGSYADPTEALEASGDKKPSRKAGQGTSLFLFLLPLLNHQEAYQQWNFGTNVAGNGSAGSSSPAQTEVGVFYCPSRRSSMEASSRFSQVKRVGPTWTGGGNDYAGCVGSGIAFVDESVEIRQTYALNAAQLAATIPAGGTVSLFNQDPSHAGIFGVNSSTSMAAITDGASNTILIAERRIFRDPVPAGGATAAQRTSSDGWAWGGPATLFSTNRLPQPPGSRYGRNFDEAGSEHPLGLNVLAADGSVRFVSLNVDQRSWSHSGNMAQGSPANAF